MHHWFHQEQLLAGRRGKMKKHILIYTLFIFCIANALDVNVPPNFSIITFAINEYDIDPYLQRTWQSDVPYAIKTANTLVNSFKSNLKNNYANVSFASKEYKDAAVTKSRFISETNNYNFVFYNGHGRENRITMWPYDERVLNTDKAFGGNTYWVMLNSCKVFKNGESSQNEWFAGVHSILGYSSLSWSYYRSYRCGFLYLSTCYNYSYFTERDFATNWIKGKQKIWDAYMNAVYKWIYKDGGYGVEPKIVYRYGYVDGKFFDPWEETFENSYQKPVFKNSGEYVGIGSRWCTMGTPSY